MLPGLAPPMLLKAAVKGPLAFRSESSNRVTSASTNTCNTPVGAQAGDVLVAVISFFNNTNAATIPSGWTELGNVVNAADRLTIAYVALASAPPVSYAFSASAATDITVTLLCIANADIAEIGTFGTDANAASTAPAFTPSRAGLLFAAFSKSQTATTPTAGPSGMTLVSQSTASRPVNFVYQNNAASPGGVITTAKTVTWAGAGRTETVQIQVEQLP